MRRVIKQRQKWESRNRDDLLQFPLAHTCPCLPLSTYTLSLSHTHGSHFCTHTLIYAPLLNFVLVHAYIFTQAYFLAHPLAYILTQMISTGNPVSCKKENVWFLPIKIFSILQRSPEVLPLLGLPDLSLTEPQPSLSPGSGSPRKLWIP